jgi:AcrR family transcriptional regulator
MPSPTDTRARLLVAARQAFADLGYDKARVEDIVTRAGVGHGTFYAYFPNKRAALAALVHDFAEAQLKLASEPWRPGDVRASLTEALTGIVALYDRDADLITLWTTTAANDPELSELVDDVRRQFVARLARNIERSQAQGMARPVDPQAAAIVLAAMFQQTMVWLIVRNEPIDRDVTVATLIDLWYHALYIPRSAK